MKITDKQKIIIGIIMITLAFGANGMHIKNKNLEIEQAKTDLIKKELELKEAKKPSEIERLGSYAEEFRRMSEKNLKDIKNLEKKYEFNILTYRCFSEQVNRLLKNEQVDEKFCKVITNLEQFRLKK